MRMMLQLWCRWRWCGGRCGCRERRTVVISVAGGGGGGCFGFVGAFRFPATATDGDVAEDATLGPVAAAVLAEMARLGKVVVVVVTELGVE